jgi:hypothetical protein
MKVTEIRTRLLEKLDRLSPLQLNSVLQFVEFLQYNSSQLQDNRTMEERRIFAARFGKMCEKTQALHADEPLTEEEIQAEIDAYRSGN